MLMSREICATLTPRMAGSMSLPMRRVCGSASDTRRLATLAPMRGNIPSRLSATSCVTSCSTPPTMTPMHSAYTGWMPMRANHGAPHQAEAIMATLSSTGVAAGTA